MLYPEKYGGHPHFPRSTDFAVVHRDRNYGKGVVSYRDFRAGDLVAVIAGEVLDEINQHTLQIAPGRHLYDPYFTGYLLHSCEPNLSVNMQEMRVTALRDICAGDFLSMDYAETEEHLFRQFACSCGSVRCRGWITGSRDVVDEVSRLKSRRRQRVPSKRAG